MPESDEITAGVKRLRMTYAINNFKHLLLDGLHVAGEDQSDTVFRKISNLFPKEPLCKRTLHNLFVNSASVTPQPGTINAMDEIGERFLYGARQSSGIEGPALNGYFDGLVRGGLLSEMTIQTKSKNVLDVLMTRACKYQPRSPIHLHFDAIETAAWAENFKGVPWASITQVAAARILEILSQRWGPRHGFIYSKFSSNFRLKWEAADSKEQARILAGLAVTHPNSFERLMEAGAHPDWPTVGCDADIAPAHIYKLLFALASVPDFLVADRFQAWALDLATAALAMYASAWTDRYTTMGVRVYDEKIFWMALEKVYFDPVPFDSGDELLPAMERLQASWGADSLNRFKEARTYYQDVLSQGGISAQEVRKCAMNATERHPLVFYGGPGNDADPSSFSSKKTDVATCLGTRGERSRSKDQ